MVWCGRLGWGGNKKHKNWEVVAPVRTIFRCSMLQLLPLKK